MEFPGNFAKFWEFRSACQIFSQTNLNFIPLFDSLLNAGFPPSGRPADKVNIIPLTRIAPVQAGVRIRPANKQMNKGSGLQQGLGLAFRLGTEMVVTTMIGVLMGYAMDHFFNTRPWGILAGVIFGGAAGCLRVYRTAMGLQVDEDKNNGDQTPKGKGL